MEKNKPTTAEESLSAISKEVARLQVELPKYVEITTRAEYADSTEFLKAVKARIKKVEELRKFFTAPLNDQVKKINKMFGEMSDPLESIFNKLDMAGRLFLRAEEEKARAEEKRLADLQAKKNEKRVEAGKELDLTIKTVERAEATVKTETGAVTAKKVWKYKITDINLVPRYLLRCEVVNANVMAEIAKGVRQIDGLEIYEDYQQSVRLS